MQESSFGEQTFSVSQLNRKVKDLLEAHFPIVWIEGEISNISMPSSGHWYFTLKDTNAQVSGAMFKRRNTLVKFKPEIGEHVKIRARVSLYEGRGDYQLIAEHMEQAGFGILQKRFNELKDKLQAEGLFDQTLKQEVPKFIETLGVITSPTGAAVRDVLSVIKRRFPAMRITIIPAAVQGEDAPNQLIKALDLADGKGFDALLLCRGGGSIEDLWAFNSEKLARKIVSCSTPLVCGVGHEVDFTIADYVSDIRAPTPSAAAEILSQDQSQIGEKLIQLSRRLSLRMKNITSQKRDKLFFSIKQLRHPRKKVEQWQQRLDQLEIRLMRSFDVVKKESTTRLFSLSQRHIQASPKVHIKHRLQRLATLESQLKNGTTNHLSLTKKRFQYAVSKLDIVSPMATITRGYSIASNVDGKIIRSVNDVRTDEEMTTRVSDGNITTVVKFTEEKKNEHAL